MHTNHDFSVCLLIGWFCILIFFSEFYRFFGTDNAYMLEKTSLQIFSKRAFARKKGRNNVTVDDLVHVITPKGRGGFTHLFLS